MVSIAVNSIEHYETRVGDRLAAISGSQMTHMQAAEKAYSEATGVMTWEDTFILERAGDWRIYGIQLLGGKVERVAVLHVESEVRQ